MPKSKLLLLLFLGGFLINCSSDEPITEITTPDEETKLYFPPVVGTTWETISSSELGWDAAAIQALYAFLEEKDTKGFVVLKNGKIALEWYAADHDQDTPWYWASAGKTLTAFTTGIALEEGHLALTDKTSDYLGTGWTSLPTEKEDLITVRHQLTMTSGLDDTQGDCKTPDCLTYLADAGTRWAYHNAPYTLIQDVVSDAVQSDYETYFDSKLKDKIGMTGQWLSTNGENNVYWSTARSMARFGLLNLNNGVWDQEVILGDTVYLNAMKNTSQDLNKSYGYLWWLNGKESAMLPTLQTVFQNELMPDAPDDLYAGLGKNDQKLHIVPSQNLVVVRMGDDTGDASAGPSSFDNELWIRLNAVLE
ncbi:MAG: serine hydrolase [Flavobacteriaceae bacterium]